MTEVSNAHDRTTKDRKALLGRLKEDLGGFWTINWERVLTDLELLDPTEKERGMLAELAVKYVNTAMKNGTFGNLEGIQPVMAYLNIESLVFTAEWLQELRTMMARFSSWFLYDMTPALWDGKLFGGEKYDSIEYTKKLLREQRLVHPGEDIDVLVNKIWQLREIMVKLHYLQSRGMIGDIDQLTGVKCIELLGRRD